MMGWSNGAWTGGDWVAMVIVMIVFWGALIALAVWGVRRARSDRGPGGAADRADALLAARFARGEIDGEEFARSRDLLRSNNAAR